MLTRRLFLKSSGVALASFGCLPPFLHRMAIAAESPSSSRKKILIAIFQRGAADGLNMVVPFGEKFYYEARPTIAIPAPQSGSHSTAIDLDGFFGLHPALAPFKKLYDAGHLAILHAAGSPDNTRSHFDAQDFMETGTPGVKSTPDGWLNRYLQTKKSQRASPFRAVALSPNLPRALYGSAPAVAMTSIQEFALRGGPLTDSLEKSFEALYHVKANDVLHTTGAETFKAIEFLKQSAPQNYPVENGAEYPRGRYGDALRQIAQLTKADIGLEIAFADVGGWDHHVNEGGTEGQLAQRLAEFSQGLTALVQDLGDRMEHVVILTMSEFGRMVRENGNRGTDHGHANCMFVVGGNVNGGKVYGKWPGLAPDLLYEGRDLALTTDFRDVFAEIAAHHLGNTNFKTIFPNYKVELKYFRNFIKKA